MKIDDKVKIKKKGIHKGKEALIKWFNIARTEFEVEITSKNGSSFIIELKDKDIEIVGE